MINNYENFDMVLHEMFSGHKDLDMTIYSEEEKIKFADKVVTKLVNDIRKRVNKNYKLVDRTKGDFTKIGCYKEIGKALNFLKKECDSKHSAELKKRTDVLLDSYKMIVSHKDVFTAAYQVGNDVLIMTYNVIGVSIIKGTSEAISMFFHMSDDYKLGNKEYKSSTIDSLQDLNRLAASGKIRRMGDNLISRREEVVTSLGLGVVAVVILILKNIKVLVYNYYHSRVELADHVRNVQEYVACKADRTMDTKLKAKQDKWVEKLGELADKIDIDARKSEIEASKSVAASDASIADMPTDWLF